MLKNAIMLKICYSVRMGVTFATRFNTVSTAVDHLQVYRDSLPKLPRPAPALASELSRF